MVERLGTTESHPTMGYPNTRTTSAAHSRGSGLNLEDRRHRLSSLKHNRYQPPSPEHTQQHKVVASRYIELPHLKESFLNKDLDETSVIHVKGSVDDGDDGLFMDCEELKRYMADGPIRFRTVTFIGAIFMLVASFIDYQEEKNYTYYGYDSMSPLFVGITIYVWIFGLFIASLEIRPFHMTVSIFHRFILRYFSILRFAWGRGCFYIFSGSLQFVTLSKCNMMAGGFMVCLGAISIVTGRVAGRKLKNMVKNIGSKNRLTELFSKHDKDRDGYLNVKEFQHFMRDADVHLSPDEFMNAFQAIDANNDRRITLKELKWWFATAKRETGIFGKDGDII